MQRLHHLQEPIKLPEGCSQEQYVAEITRQISRLHEEQQRIMTEQLNQWLRPNPVAPGTPPGGPSVPPAAQPPPLQRAASASSSSGRPPTHNRQATAVGSPAAAALLGGAAAGAANSPSGGSLLLRSASSTSNRGYGAAGSTSGRRRGASYLSTSPGALDAGFMGLGSRPPPATAATVSPVANNSSNLWSRSPLYRSSSSSGGVRGGSSSSRQHEALGATYSLPSHLLPPLPPLSAAAAATAAAAGRTHSIAIPAAAAGVETAHPVTNSDAGGSGSPAWFSNNSGRFYSSSPGAMFETPPADVDLGLTTEEARLLQHAASGTDLAHLHSNSFPSAAYLLAALQDRGSGSTAAAAGAAGDGTSFQRHPAVTRVLTGASGGSPGMPTGLSSPPVCRGGSGGLAEADMGSAPAASALLSGSLGRNSSGGSGSYSRGAWGGKAPRGLRHSRSMGNMGSFKRVPSLSALAESLRGVLGSGGSSSSPGGPLGLARAPSSSAPCCLICLDAVPAEEAFYLECNCKGDMALRHKACAVKWFSLKGNTTCDVCKHPVTNLPPLPPPPPGSPEPPPLDFSGLEEEPPTAADHVFDVIRVTWVTMICCILFLDLPLFISFLVGLALGLLYVGCRTTLTWRAAAARHQEDEQEEEDHPEQQQQQQPAGAGEGLLTAPLLEAEGEEAV